MKNGTNKYNFVHTKNTLELNVHVKSKLWQSLCPVTDGFCQTVVREYFFLIFAATLAAKQLQSMTLPVALLQRFERFEGLTLNLF